MTELNDLIHAGLAADTGIRLCYHPNAVTTVHHHEGGKRYWRKTRARFGLWLVRRHTTRPYTAHRMSCPDCPAVVISIAGPPRGMAPWLYAEQP